MPSSTATARSRWPGSRRAARSSSPRRAARPTGTFETPAALTDATDGRADEPALGVAPSGDVTVVYAFTAEPRPCATTHVRAQVLDVNAPTLTATVPATGTAGAALAMSAAATDLWGPVSVTWDFGDGVDRDGHLDEPRVRRRRHLRRPRHRDRWQRQRHDSHPDRDGRGRPACCPGRRPDPSGAVEGPAGSGPAADRARGEAEGDQHRGRPPGRGRGAAPAERAVARRSAPSAGRSRRAAARRRSTARLPSSG